jgi:AcrR family transcriptional regulator
MSLTKDDIINLADEFIRTRGFNAFSYADIAEALKVQRPAIHYHFPTKADLGVGVIDKECQIISWQRYESKDLPGDIQLKKIVERFFDRSRKGTICLTGSLTPDYATLPLSMQLKVREMVDTILDWMTICLEKGRAEKRLHFQGKAKDRALTVISGLLSSLLLSRILGEDVFDRMIGRLLKDMDAKFRIAERSSPDKDNSIDDRLSRLWG